MLKAYKYRIFPNSTQIEQLIQAFGCVRFVYNLGLETKIAAYISQKKSLSFFDLCKQMVELKDTEATWLTNCPSQALQMSLKNLDSAYNQFFKGKEFPKFKNKHSKQSIQFPQGVRLNFDNNTIFLPKLKTVSIDFSRQFKGEIKTCTVSKTTTGKYFISILVDNQAEPPSKSLIKESTTVGIDMGVKTFATLSDGTSFENLKFLRSNLSKLKIEQKVLSKRFKKAAAEQSNSYKKQKFKVSLLHEKIKNQRNDFLHKVSTSIVKKYDTIVLEDLNIKGMMKNHTLALAVGELGWNTFETYLNYKAEWYGKNIIYIGRFEPSSKICNNCGTINKDLKLSDRTWACNSCKATHDRDMNAAINIKKIGLRIGPLGVKVEQ